MGGTASDGLWMRDADVRAAVRGHLNQIHLNDDSTRVVEEMGIWSGTVRIDIAVINGELSGYELKSDRDTLERLPVQIDYYSRVFDRLTLVAGERHLERAAAMIPSWWGLTEAISTDGVIALRETRKALLNPSPHAYLVAQLLWKVEALKVLEDFNLAKGWRSKSASAIHHRLANSLEFDNLRERVRDCLKGRTEWLGQTIRDQRHVTIE